MSQRPWTEDEFILALELYFRIPFGSIGKTNPDIIKLANFIGRTPSSVGMRLSNYAHLDPNLEAKGLNGGGKNCAVYWDKYSGDLGALKRAAAQSKLAIISQSESDNPLLHRIKEADRLVDDMYDFKFQDIVLANYGSRCVISGMAIPSLVMGCHIIPTSVNDEENLTPSNGICLTLLHAKAFVEGFISFDGDYRLHISPELKQYQFENGYSANFKRYENRQLNLSGVVAKPAPEYLDWHYQTVYRRS